jgi:hypothetical protein
VGFADANIRRRNRLQAENRHNLEELNVREQKANQMRPGGLRQYDFAIDRRGKCWIVRALHGEASRGRTAEIYRGK